MASIAFKPGKALPMPFLMALLAGSVVGAGAFVVPGGLLDAVVAATGLSQLVPAAAPPLGMTARILFAIAGGAIAMLLTAGGLAIADRVARARPRRERPEPLAVEEFAPRRRILAQPSEDGAPRRPIFAESDLGTPDVLVTETVAEETVYELATPLSEAREVQPELLDLEPIAQAMWRLPAATPQDEPEHDETGYDYEAEPEFAEFTVEAPVVQDAPTLIAAEPIRRSRDYDSLSLAELVHRLDVGLEHKRRVVETVAPAPAFTPSPIAAGTIPADIDAALRDALGTLRRMNARSH